MSLSSAQFKTILREYDYRRTKNSQEQRLRQEEIYDKISSIRDINQHIAKRGIEVSKKILKDPENKALYLNDLKDELLALSEKRKALLVQAGYNENYLEPIYDCEYCQDTGYIENTKCQCFKQALIDLAYNQSNIQSLLLKENFSTFSFDFYSPEINKLGISPLDNIKGVYTRCKRFVDDFDTTSSNLILYGQTGLGKTFLCNCIAKELLDTSHSVLYLSAYNLFKLLEAYRFNDEEQDISYDDIDDLNTCDLLIIDDLGSEIINSFTSTELFNCLNTRLQAKKSTVISTNLDPSGWSKLYSERIVSRILGSFSPLRLIGEDIRVRKYN